MWNLIETAPKNETPILIDFGSLGIHRVIWTTSINGTEGWCVEDNKYGPYALRGYQEDEIRGWLPLPKSGEKDKYCDTDACVKRLWDEYVKHRKLIVAFDYDETVFDYHKKGRTYEKVINLLRECQDLDFYLVLFTACDPSQYEDQRNYLRELGIEIASINENPIDLPFGNNGKIYYNILLDDRAGLGQAVDILQTLVTRINYLEYC
jgi:hypothetical protein